MTNVLLIIEYDGTEFSGWQRQPNKRTVQGEIEKALTKLCKQPIKINGTSRTDAGVHAYAQAANFSGDFEIPVDRIKPAVNGLLPNDIYIKSAEKVNNDFHARFSAKGKTYHYRVLCTDEKNVFSRNYFYNIVKELNIEAMRKAACFLKGTHDFAAFMSSGSRASSTIRSVYALNIMEEERYKEVINIDGKVVTIEITGDSFLYNMVRIIARSLVEVGLGKLKPDEIPYIIKMKERSLVRLIAPAGGLYLYKIYFTEAEIKEIIG